MYIEQIRELQETHKDIVNDLYMTVSDIIGLLACMKAGCVCKMAHIKEMVADAEHMREIMITLNAASVDISGRPICPEIERATCGQILAAVVRHSKGQVHNPPNLDWLDGIEWPK